MARRKAVKLSKAHLKALQTGRARYYRNLRKAEKPAKDVIAQLDAVLVNRTPCILDGVTKDKVGKTVKLFRMVRGFSQSDLAERVGMVQANLSKLENGRIDVGVVKMEELARVFNKTLEEFIGSVRNVDLDLVAKLEAFVSQA